MTDTATVIEHPANAIALSTKARYEVAIKTITKGLGKFLADATAEDVIKCITQDLKSKKKEPISLNSQRLYLSAMLWYSTNEDDKAKYKAEFNKLRPLADAEVESQSLEGDRAAKYMEWPEVMKCQEKAKELYETGKMNLNDFLLVCLYTLQPPVRADYAQMRIVKKITNCGERYNYAEFLADGSVMYEFNQYKTMLKYGKMNWLAHPTVSELIRKKKAECFGKVCMVSSLDRAKMGRRLSEVFVMCGGKPITITLLRHSYITQFYKDFPNPSIGVKNNLARRMLHSRFVQEVYNVLELPEEEDESIEPESEFGSIVDQIQHHQAIIAQLTEKLGEIGGI